MHSKTEMKNLLSNKKKTGTRHQDSIIIQIPLNQIYQLTLIKVRLGTLTESEIFRNDAMTQ